MASAQKPGGDASLRYYQRSECAVFRRANDPYGGLSNMTAQFAICVGRVRAWSSESLYQACRFPHMPDVQAEVLAERSPMTAKMKSKKYRQDSRPDWDTVRVAVMRWCLRAKLLSNWDAFGALVLSTGDRPIVEESPKDGFWGAQPDDTGQLVGRNVLGRLLMELRQQLRETPESLHVLVPPQLTDFRLLGDPVPPISLERSESPEPVTQVAERKTTSASSLFHRVDSRTTGQD